MKTKAVATRLEQEVAEKFEAKAVENHLLPSELARIILSAWATGEIDEALCQFYEDGTWTGWSVAGGPSMDKASEDEKRKYTEARGRVREDLAAALAGAILTDIESVYLTRIYNNPLGRS